MLKDNIRLSRSGISGGYILWADNVSEISNTIKELQDINKTLNERRHTLIQGGESHQSAESAFAGSPIACTIKCRWKQRRSWARCRR